MSVVVLLTSNKHKVRELRPLLTEYGVPFETVPVKKFEIRSDSVVEIARTAAVHAFEQLGRPIVVDDTALFIDALNGFPRTYPAFVLQTIGVDGVLRLMDGIEDRSARFVTAVGFADDGVVETFVGEMRGHISDRPIGSGGFGYDPIFVPEGEDRTYAQLSLSEKTRISHRTRAFREFLTWYVNTYT